MVKSLQRNKYQKQTNEGCENYFISCGFIINMLFNRNYGETSDELLILGGRVVETSVQEFFSPTDKSIGVHDKELNEHDLFSCLNNWFVLFHLYIC